MKKPLVMGVGITGTSVSKFLSENSIHHSVFDLNNNFKHLDASFIDKFFKNEDISILEDINQIYVSPGIKKSNLILSEASSKNIPITSDIDLYIKKSSSKPILITGTNGKTSVARMTDFLLKEFYGKDSIGLGGNIGEPILGLLYKKLEYSIIEVSSYQLEHSKDISSEISILLNIGQDHLDRHVSLAEYRKVKEKVFNNSNFLIFQDITEPKLNKHNSKINFLSIFNEFEEEFISLLPLGWPSHEILNLKASISIYLGCEVLKGNIELSSVNKYLKNNLKKIILKFKNFKRSPHRFEFLGEKNGVLFVDDSKSTNIPSMINALNSARELKEVNETILIIGGDSKGQDFGVLNLDHFKEVKKVFILGKDSKTILKSISNLSMCQEVNSMEEAVSFSKEISEIGSLVLLSPGCASLDMYNSFKERGEHFRSVAGF